MTPRSAASALVLATACSRGAPSPGSRTGATLQDGAAYDEPLPHETVASVRSMCPEVVDRFEARCLRPLPLLLFTRTLETQRVRAAERESLPRSFLHGWVGLELPADAGIITAYEETVELRDDDSIAEPIASLASERLDEYLGWCFGRGAVSLPAAAYNQVTIPADGGHGATTKVTMAIDMLRDEVLPRTPLCREEHEWAIRRANESPARDGDKALAVTALRITNATDVGMLLASWSHLDVRWSEKADDRRFERGVTKELAVTPTGASEGWVNVSFDYSPHQWVLIWWQGPGANAVGRSDGRDPVWFGARTEMLRGVAKVTIGSVGADSSPQIGLHIEPLSADAAVHDGGRP